MKFGAHLSIADGLLKTVKSTREIGANCLQIFSSPPRNWKSPKFTKKEIKEFREGMEKENIFPLFIHAKYLVNPGSENREIRKKSIKSLIEDLNLAKSLGAKGVIFHPRIKNFKIFTKAICQILEKTPDSVFLILENSAQSKIEEIERIIKKIKDKRLGFCLDLAHAFEAGYDLRRSQEIEKIFKIIKTKIGFKRWFLIHANDSKTDLGSFYDLHADIGKGKIGKIPFFIFLNHPISEKLPFIIETPGFREEGLRADKRNLKALQKLAGKRLDRSFFERKTSQVAKELLGKYLILKRGQKMQIAKILETEAYVGPKDKASHAFSGKTKRNEIMWDSPGKLYVFLIYGMHHCLNVVTEREGFPAAVLIRRAEPVFGIEDKMDGPAKICKAFKITKKYNGIDITKSDEIFIKDIGERPKKIISAPRIGVDYAREWAKKKLRFYIK